MIVVHDSPDMPADFKSKMDEHAKRFPGQGCTQSPQWINANSKSSGNDVTQALKDALAVNAPVIRERLQSESRDAGSSFLEGEKKASHLRRRLHEILSHKAAIVDVQHELLKMSQGLPVTAGARDVLNKVSKKSRAGSSSFA